MPLRRYFCVTFALLVVCAFVLLVACASALLVVCAFALLVLVGCLCIASCAFSALQDVCPFLL